MNRRGHLSHKIPNVKLRPAPASAAPTSSTSTRKGKQRDISPEVWREAYEDGEDEDASRGDVAGTSRPWESVVITFTGVDDKPLLANLVKELGGQVENALTVHVTHVVATGFGSPKYLYALEHRIPIMEPDWIQDAHARWLDGEECNVTEEAEQHRLRPFKSLKISISGIEDLSRRKLLIKYINDSGGTYSKDLDRSCTHLISAKITSDSKSSEKVKWALKELQQRDTARLRGKKVEGEDMRIVYEEWIWDCVGYRGRWKEDYYDARKARKEARVRLDDVLDGSIFQETTSRQPNPTEEKDEPAVVRKRKRKAMDSLVGDIISIKTITKREPNPVKSEPTENDLITPVKEPDNEEMDMVDVRSEIEKPSNGPRQPTEGRREPERKPSMLHSSRATAFAIPTPPSDPPKPPSSFPPTAKTPPSSVYVKVEEDAPKTAARFFEGLRFSHIIEERCENLEKALLSHGAKLVSEEERLGGSEVDYIIIRLNSGKRPVQLEGTVLPVVVTECWVEGCCFEHRMLNPDGHIVFKPLPASMPIPDANILNVHLSGWSTSEMVYLKRLLTALGGQLSLKLNRQTTHLVCATSDTIKARKAPEWGVSVVRDSWLVAMGRSGKLELDADHRHGDMRTPTEASSSHKLEARIVSLANMSAVSVLGDPTFDGIQSVATSTTRGAVLPDPSARSSSQRSGPISPSRILKLTPTHVDDNNGGVLSGSAVGSWTGDVESSLNRSRVLSPPKAETARLLNSASPRAGGDSVESKISRTTSAPPNSEYVRKNDGPAVLRASSTGGAMGQLGKKDMTEVLRQLAQGTEATPSGRTKLQRRSRPSSRLKSSHGPGMSPHNQTSISPMSRLSSPPSPGELNTPNTTMDNVTSGIGGVGEGVGVGGFAEESIRVNYVDPIAERERKRLIDAVKRGEMAAAAAAAKAGRVGTATSASPSQRAKVGH